MKRKGHNFFFSGASCPRSMMAEKPIWHVPNYRISASPNMCLLLYTQRKNNNKEARHLLVISTYYHRLDALHARARGWRDTATKNNLPTWPTLNRAQNTKITLPGAQRDTNPNPKLRHRPTLNRARSTSGVCIVAEYSRRPMRGASRAEKNVLYNGYRSRKCVRVGTGDINSEKAITKCL